MWTIICNVWIFFLFTKKEDYYMEFLEYISLLLKYGLLCVISKHVGYHMKFMEFLSLLQKRGLSYAISGISFSSPKTETVICNFLNFFSLLPYYCLIYAISHISLTFQKMWTITCNFWIFFHFAKNVDYYMQFLEYITLILNHGLLYAIS